MKTRDLVAVFPERQYLRGLLLLIVAVYAFLLVSMPFDLTRAALLVGLGLLYTVVGVCGLEYCRRVPSRLIVLGYFVVLVVVLGGILVLSRGEGFPPDRAACRLQYRTPA